MSDALRKAAETKYLEVLRRMTPEEKLLKAFDLHEFAMQCFADGLHSRFPEATDNEIRSIFLERINKCHNRNY